MHMEEHSRYTAGSTQVQTVLDPFFEFAEIDAGPVEISVRGNKNQFVIVVHTRIVTQFTPSG